MLATYLKAKKVFPAKRASFVPPLLGLQSFSPPKEKQNSQRWFGERES
jgi:hypothetical protein